MTYPLKLLETVYGATVDGMVASTVRCGRDQNREGVMGKREEWYASRQGTGRGGSVMDSWTQARVVAGKLDEKEAWATCFGAKQPYQLCPIRP